MLFKNGFNVISVQIQRILMWRFWTCERSELRVRTLCNSTALAHIPLSLHYTRKCSLASTVVYLSCFQWLTHGWWSTDRCQQFLKFLKQFGRAHVSKWFILFFSDLPISQFMTFNCSYDMFFGPKNTRVKKSNFLSMNHHTNCGYCHLCIVLSITSSSKNVFCCVQLVIRFFILYLEYLRPLRPCTLKILIVHPSV